LAATADKGRRKERKVGQVVHAVAEQPASKITGVEVNESGAITTDSATSEGAEVPPSVVAGPSI
jgi:hypothetical protein